MIACLDLDEIQFPLIITALVCMEITFYPLGMDQIKKLSDFFVDNKISVPEKERTWILASGKKIVWIMGHRIDHRFRITEKPRGCLFYDFNPILLLNIWKKAFSFSLSRELIMPIRSLHLLTDSFHLIQAVGTQQDLRKQVIIFRKQSFSNTIMLLKGCSGCFLLLHAGSKYHGG